MRAATPKSKRVTRRSLKIQRKSNGVYRTPFVALRLPNIGRRSRCLDI